MSQNKRLKIFISAYACEPEKGSEPGIGWNVVNELAKYHEVHVLTRANNREVIEEALRGKTENLPVFHYYDLPHWLTFWKKKRRGYHLYYYLWQYGAFFRYAKWVNSSNFDVVQHLTFANFAMPSLFMLCKSITVWGPIGKTSTPEAIFQALPYKTKMKERLRGILMNLLCHLDPVRVMMSRKAKWIIESGMPAGKSSFPKELQAKIIQHPQTGINTDEPEYQVQRTRKDDGKIRLLICSEFLHWKGVLFSAEIFGRIAAKHPEAELLIYGSGPEKGKMKAIFEKHGVDTQIKWMGFVSKQEMMQALCDADILLYPSYHHGLATLILQAMYTGLPIVALEGDPIGLAVAEGAGLAASGSNMSEILNNLEQKTLLLIDSPELRRQLGENGRTLIRTRYEWQILCARLSQILQSISGKHP